MRIAMNRTYLPWAMAAGRAALGPVLAAGAAASWNGLALAGIVLTALVSDIYDGVLARRWGCDTAGVRLFDSMADTFFYGWTAFALWRVAPGLWRENGVLVVGVIALEAVRIAFDLAKFGKPASYHSYLAKAWGLVMATAVIAVFALGHTNWLVRASLWMGIACGVEGLAMSLILRQWRRDVKTLALAWRLRRENAAESPRTRKPVVVRVVAVLLAVMLTAATPGYAIEGREARYVGGTGTLTPDTEGVIDLSSPASFPPLHVAANSAGVRSASAECGRWWFYSRHQRL